MSLSIFDLFKVGIGPSSSHTVGPMWASVFFIESIIDTDYYKHASRIRVLLFGSLALTGKGHATDVAVLLGLTGERPDEVDPNVIEEKIEKIRAEHELILLGGKLINFNEDDDLKFIKSESLPQHPNGIRFELCDNAGIQILSKTYFSVGGGFVLSEEEMVADDNTDKSTQVAHPFKTADELLEICKLNRMTIAEVVLENEKSHRSVEAADQQFRKIWHAMDSSIDRGCSIGGTLPGGLGIKRRAQSLHDELQRRERTSEKDPLIAMDWVNLYAMAVNEENAAGGKIVTAPTNGGGGVIPAVIKYYLRFVPGSSEQGVFTFLATAAAIGMLYKNNASISAAEVGCQGEVGVACSMAAAGLTAVLGGDTLQIENAAEIGMEHNLGLTCDPINGLVQVPCIERNTMGAVKAINAARLALYSDGTHHVSLDCVIETMLETGKDMHEKYKETSEGGLAKNFVYC